MSEPLRDALIKISPGFVVGLIFIVSFLYYVLGFATESPNSPNREGSLLMPDLFLNFFYWFATPFLRRLAAWGLHPNHVTTISFVAAILAGVGFGSGHFMTGFWMICVVGSCDALDGLLARELNLQTQSGAFWDSFMDRLSEGVYLSGFVIYGAGGAMSWLALWAIIASFAVSYARARGEGLGVECTIGLMQRPERVIVVIFTTFASPLISLAVEPTNPRPAHYLVTAGLGIIAVLSTITAFRRARWILNELNADGDSDDRRVSAPES